MAISASFFIRSLNNFQRRPPKDHLHPNLVKKLYNKDIVIRRADGLTKTDGDRSQKLKRDDMTARREQFLILGL